jgi:two-component system, OmpR family, sensor histidine kinase ChvG
LPLHGAPDLIAQAMDKLFDNAMSFSPNDGWIRFRVEVLENGYVLAVANQGPLLPAEMRGRLFQSLVSVRQGRREQIHLGFGLHIVKLIARAHGGDSEIDDLPSGEGVEVRMKLFGMPRRALGIK